MSTLQGYTMKPKALLELDTCGNLYKHPRTKRQGVHGFQEDLNPVGPRVFSCKVFILAITNQIASLLSDKMRAFLSFETAAVQISMSELS